jgi:adenylyl-sulfate kinase
MYEWAGSFDFFAGDADVDSGQVTDLFTVSGRGTVLGARYNQMLPKFGNYEHRLSVGLDYRAYENNVVFGAGGPSLVPDITIHPANLTYSGQLSGPGRQTNFYVTAVHNVYPHGSDANQDAFDAQRFDADARYLLYRFGMTHAIALPRDWQVRFSASGQYTSDALVPGEQFGIGGWDSVRGFHERQFANDVGRRMSLEFFTSEFGAKIDPRVKARGLFFYDMAKIHRNDALLEELAVEVIESEDSDRLPDEEEEGNRHLQVDYPPEVWAVLQRHRARSPARGFTLFMTGLSGSGKSTLAHLLAKRIEEGWGRRVSVLDGDYSRELLTRDLSAAREDKWHNVIRHAWVAAQINRHGGVAICALVAPDAPARHEARAMVAPHGAFVEIYIKAPVEVCEARDRKSLYAKARAGSIKGLPGLDENYDEPMQPEITLEADKYGAGDLANQVLDFLKARSYL